MESVLELVRDSVPLAQIIEDFYPDLEVGDIYACLQYAIDLVAAEDINLAPVAA